MNAIFVPKYHSHKTPINSALIIITHRGTIQHRSFNQYGGSTMPNVFTATSGCNLQDRKLKKIGTTGHIFFVKILFYETAGTLISMQKG